MIRYEMSTRNIIMIILDYIIGRLYQLYQKRTCKRIKFIRVEYFQLSNEVQQKVMKDQLAKLTHNLCVVAV